VRKLTILGATGSIGMSTLDVVRQHAARYGIHALTAHRDVSGLARLCCEFEPAFACVADEGKLDQLAVALKQQGCRTMPLAGIAALEELAAAPEVDVVMAAIVGAAGLSPTIAAARAGKQILLANKESLVMAGGLLMQAVVQGGASLLPIDSEHNAVFQCLPNLHHSRSWDLERIGVRRILLTGSGGPFRTRERASLMHVDPEEACKHPNWSMGQKISVDSATMMNKGLEIIEAHWLFNAPPERIEVVVHPQSVIHSMVEYVDGSVLAQLGNPDMRTPIAQALAFPERIHSGVDFVDLLKVARLDFEAPNFERFPALNFAYDALRAGGTTPAILNAANEVAVESFLNRRLSFLGMTDVIEQTLSEVASVPADGLDHVLHADSLARVVAQRCVEQSLR
jgi:1-deoxy-D-xylulose-5-phosphate reductoisomerase